MSTERQFLSDFVVANESTAGGRLARWLSPASFVEPARCELRAPAAPARPSARLTLPVIVRDQYGETVMSPALKVEVGTYLFYRNSFMGHFSNLGAMRRSTTFWYICRRIHNRWGRRVLDHSFTLRSNRQRQIWSCGVHRPRLVV